ncbi:MAG: hypothetical protein PHE96_11125 [Methylococcales bacterium]|nr:hypothetical protein [Methylococcales bacterium]
MGFLKKLFSAIMDLISSVFETLLQALKDMWNWFYELICGVCRWVIDLFIWAYNHLMTMAYDEIVSPLLTLFQASEFRAVLNTVHDVVYGIDYFLPLHELFIVAGILLSVWVFCLIIKVILKCIPAIY